MRYHYLEAIMKEKGYKRNSLAEEIGMKPPYLAKRILGYTKFDVDEIRAIIKALNLSDKEIRIAFNFDEKVS